MTDTPLLTIYKASAGSGKTWRLTVEYLKLLISNPEAYRNILAVTFTNKATAEMKERVLNGLYEMMQVDVSLKPEGMLETLCQELNCNPGFVKKQAAAAMGFLLHDYGRFRIETIDSFFQSVLRNLARELGLGAYLNIELNNSAVLNDAVDRLVDKAAQNPEILKWMTDYVEEMVQEGRSWKINQALKKFGNTIFKEYFKEKEGILEAKLSDKGFLNRYKKELFDLENSSRNKIDQAANRFFKVLEENELEVEDFLYGKSGVCGYFLKLKQGKFDKEGFEMKRVQACLESPSSWTTAKNPLRKQIMSLADEVLIPLLEETERIRARNSRDYFACQLARAHLYKVGLLTDISREVNELNLENNRFLLSNTNALLKSLMEGSDASFVYEKTGTELHHILFDEFQDTSRMQWDTFRPLLAEGLANGYKSLIVGDEKQSIYRWRNGDWRILGNIETEMHPALVRKEFLKKNWRSQRNIVEFNNSLFQSIERRINQLHFDQFEEESEDLTNAYSDVVQASPKIQTKGLVEIAFPYAKKAEDYRQLVLEQLIKKVEMLQEQGIRPDQIAILIRKNKFIPKIATYFAEYKARQHNSYCYDIVSDEAFLLESSKAVQLIVDALRLLNDAENPLIQALLKLDYQGDVLHGQEDMDTIFRQSAPSTPNFKTKTAYKKTFRDSNPEKKLLPEAFVRNFEMLQRMPLYELVEELYRIFDLKKMHFQDSYLFAFMDGLSEYLMHGASDIASFLNYWDEELAKKSIPSGSGVNGIRILSIHKAKGLEFHTVLVPFCDWKLLSEVKDQIWCQPETSPYNQMDLLPIDYRKEMNESCFSKDFQEETLQLWVDNLNLLYVAFTRAKHNLFVFCEGKEPQKELKSLATVSNLIQDLFEHSLQNSSTFSMDMQNGYRQAVTTGDGDYQEAIFRFGQLSLEEGEEQEKAGHPELHLKGKDLALPFQSFAHKIHFRQSNRSVEFSKGKDPEEFSNSYIDRGKLLHRLFSEINSIEDTEEAIHNLLSEGLITSAEQSALQLFVEKALKQVESTGWYSNRYKLYNECSILFSDSRGNLHLKRPDRVMLSDEGVKLVDFKFGKPSPRYRKQVLEYMHLLQKMGYSNVEGYLWYVDEEQVEEVLA